MGVESKKSYDSKTAEKDNVADGTAETEEDQVLVTMIASMFTFI